MQTALQNLRLQKIITGLGVGLFIIKLVAWYLTGSVAILTDALESTVNVVAGFIGIYTLYVSAKPKDNDHPYGHGKAEFISAAIEGTLISVAGVIIIYEAINNLYEPHAVASLDYGIVLVASTAIINYIAGAICIKTGRKNNSLALIASGKHLQTDTYSTVGIIIGLILLYFLHYSWIDSVVAMVFAVFIMLTGYKIIRTSIAGIMDEADTEILNKLVVSLNEHKQPNWIDLHNLRIIKYGGTLHLDCHLTIPWYLNVHEAHDEIDALAKLAKDEFGQSLELFVHADGCLDFSCKICDKKGCAVRKFDFERKIAWTMENISKNSKHTLDV
ncbi:MAG: cation diffusion facilitator family transporter [Ferruginibacter sp.]